MKTKEYPVGHPTVVNHNFDYSLNSYFGFIKCKILTPRNLYLPILPLRLNGKLEFVLCYQCAKEKNQGNCEHPEEGRCLINTWTSVELIKAIEKGYVIKYIYQVLNYSDHSNEMFKDYISLWQKEKAKASGFTSNCRSHSDKVHFVRNYFANENVQLQVDEIEKNPGKRFISKLLSNSFWGKLSQRPNLTRTAVCHEYSSYWNIINNDDYIIKGEEMPNEKTIIVSYKFKDENLANPGNTSLAIASFVTSYARLHLYSFMERINENGQDRLLYFDTDSVIFVKKPLDFETLDWKQVVIMDSLLTKLPIHMEKMQFVKSLYRWVLKTMDFK